MKIWLILYFLLGCVSPRPREVKTWSLENLKRDQQLRLEKMKHFEARLDIQLKGKNSISGSGRYWTESAKKSRLDIRDTLGRTQFQMGLLGIEMTAFYPTQNTVYLDRKSGKAYSKEIFGTAIDFSEFRNLSVGILPSAIFYKNLKEPEWEDGVWTFKVQNNWEVSFVSDPPVLSRVRWSGEEPWTIVLRDTEPCCDSRAYGFLLAHTVEAQFEGGSFTIEWNEINFSSQSYSEELFSIPLPAQVRRRHLH